MGVLTAERGMPLWGDYTRFVGRHRTRLALAVAIGALAGLTWSLAQPASYSATASVVLAPVPVYVTSSTLELVAPEVSIDTDAQLLSSPRVLGAVGDELDVDPARASEHLVVTASPNTQVLHLTVSASSRSAAAAAANAAAAGLAEVRREKLGALRRAQLRQLRLSLSEHEELLSREQGRRLVVPSRDELFDQVLELRTSLDELEATRRQPAEVIRPAVPPDTTDYANTEVPVTSGAMLGLVVGCLLSAGRDHVRRPGRPPSRRHPLRSPPGHAPGTAPRPKEYDHVT